MKKNYTLLQRIFFTLLLGISTQLIQAQVANYVFSQTVTTYTPITGGTLLGNTASDDQRFVDPAVPLGGTALTGVGLPIGFNFTYNGIIFDRFAVNNNGWISLGSSGNTPSVDMTSSGNNAPLASLLTTTPPANRNRIAAIGKDMIAQSISSIRIETIGVTPNRVLAVQWQDYKRFNLGTGDTLNFQIRLYETTNEVQVHFGRIIFGPGTAGGPFAPHCGLGGNVSTDFNNRFTLTNWNATTAGTANNQGCEINSGVTYPVNGRLFSWTPACFGTPVAGTAAAQASVCSGVNFDLTLSGSSADPGITLQWQSSADGVSYTNIGGATTATSSVALTSATYYQAIITCTNSGFADTSNAVLVALSPGTACYCTSKANDPSDTKIDSVQFLNITTGSPPSVCDSFTDYTSLVASVQRTVPFNISIRNGSCGGGPYTSYLGVYIDLDQDGTFNPFNEMVYSYGPITTYNGIPNGSITIPNSAVLGQTRMRIILAEGLAVPTPCQDYDFGATQDYTLDITPAPACSGIPSAGNITGTSSVCLTESASLSLSGQSVGTDLQWQLSADGNTWNDIAGANNASYTIPAVTDTVYYRVKVTCVDSAFTAAFAITLKSHSVCYCNTGLLGFCGNAAINNVNIPTTSLNNSSGCTATGNGDAYTVFPPLGSATTTLIPGSSYTFNVNCDATARISAWIDYNQNGTFEASEWTQVSDSAINASGTLNIPLTALPGQTGMRVRTRSLAGAIGPNDACTAFGSGETEDYIITIDQAPLCPIPTVGGTASGPSSANLGVSYTYILSGSTGTIQWESSTASATGPFTAIGGANDDSLTTTFNTIDTYWVRAFVTTANCSPDSSNVIQTAVSNPGDDVCDAITLTFGANGPYSTTFATVQAGEPAPSGGGCSTSGSWCDSAVTNSRWFKFTAPASGRVGLQSPGFNTQLALWDAATCGDILTGGAVLIAANDDDPNNVAHGGAANSSYIDYALCLTPGKTYYVQLDAFQSPGGSTTVNLYDLEEVEISPDGQSDVSCFGLDDGSIDMVVYGGSWNYTYLWSNGEQTEDISGLAPGTYTLTVTEPGCSVSVVSSAITISEPTPLFPILDSVVHAKCNGDSTGGIFVSVTGGTTGYTYAWSNGSSDPNLTGVPAGSYTGTVTDANGCSVASPSIPINEPSLLSVNLDSVTNNTCNGAAAGAVYITVSGGTGSYVYSWSNGAGTEDIAGVASDNYDVSVTDANGCSATPVSATVSGGNTITVSIDSVISNICAGGSTGAVYITVSGGTPGYTFDWSNGATTEDIIGLVADDYEVSIMDAIGCADTISATVGDGATITVALDSLHQVSCQGLADGAVFISVSGGTPGYFFDWSNNDVTEDISGLGGGNYTVDVNDANGCTSTFGPVVITEPAALTLTVDSTQKVSCFGGNNGAIFTTTTGGTTPVSILWDNGAATNDIINLTARTYSATLKDANGCTATDSATITQPTVLSVTGVSTPQIQGGAFGSINLAPAGGTPPYSYLWNNGTTTTEDRDIVVAGNYSVTITDANGCTISFATVVSLITGIQSTDKTIVVNLYPNPTQDKVSVELELNEANDVVISVYNMSGQIVQEFSERNILTATFNMSFENEASGVYFAKIKIGETTLTRRIIVAR